MNLGNVHFNGTPHRNRRTSTYDPEGALLRLLPEEIPLHLKTPPSIHHDSECLHRVSCIAIRACVFTVISAKILTEDSQGAFYHLLHH